MVHDRHQNVRAGFVQGGKCEQLGGIFDELPEDLKRSQPLEQDRLLIYAFFVPFRGNPVMSQTCL
jgi:hypothetical protein